MNNNIKLLLVDDDARNLRILEEMLEDDYLLETASSAQEALEKINGFEPHILILDRMMPDLDGLELCRAIRQHDEYENLGIIITSGRARKSDQAVGLEAGANYYLTKPFSEDDLLKLIKKTLRQHEAFV